MPEIDIRPAIAEDIPLLIEFEHQYKSSYVWQMDLKIEEAEVTTNFREVRLPRVSSVDYPRNPASLLVDWNRRSALLVGLFDSRPVGYISINEGIAPTTAWVTDVVVTASIRRKGIASALILAAQAWAHNRDNRRMILEVQSKNTPAIHLALKLGYEYCGYNDHYYSNQDIALFFTQFLK
jgi:ribosomal protein S18 acetylase RimI-like enzyme